MHLPMLITTLVSHLRDGRGGVVVGVAGVAVEVVGSAGAGLHLTGTPGGKSVN